MFWPDPTHQPIQPPTHPPNHTPTRGWEILHRFQIFKRNWNILISSSVIKFLLILGVHPLGGDGWVHGGGGGYGCVGRCLMHTHMHTHAHARMHARTCMLNMLIMQNMDASMSAAICNFYTCIHVCMCVCLCARVCMCGGTPPMPPDALHTPPPTCPLPRAAGSPKQQNSISPELIEIIRFCLKILYLWTFLNSYRL